MASGSDGAAASGPTSLSAPFRVWVHVKDGGPVEYDVDCTWSVSRLLKQVHDGEKLTVGYGKLTLYTSGTKEQALDPGDFVKDVDGGRNSKNPLFVDFPKPDAKGHGTGDYLDAEERPAKRARFEEHVEKVQAVLERVDRRQEQMHQSLSERLSVITAGVFNTVARSASTRDPYFRELVSQHYGSEGCLVLQSLFPLSAQSNYGYKHTIADHIYPLSQFHNAALLDIDINDPRNALMLLRPLERAHGDDSLVFEPVPSLQEGLALKIHVAVHLQDQYVVDKTSDWVWIVAEESGADEGKWLTFGDLHGRIVHVVPKPFMRSLYVKARTAYTLHRHEYPNPDDNGEFCAELCPRIDNVKRLFESRRFE